MALGSGGSVGTAGSVGRSGAGVGVGVGEGDWGLCDAVWVGAGGSVTAGEGVVGALVAGDTDADVAGAADSGGGGFGAGVAFGTTDELAGVELAGVELAGGLADWPLAGADVPRPSERASTLRAITTAATPANVTRT